MCFVLVARFLCTFFLEFKGIMPRPFKNYQKTKPFTAQFAQRAPKPNWQAVNIRPATTKQNKTDRVKLQKQP